MSEMKNKLIFGHFVLLILELTCACHAVTVTIYEDTYRPKDICMGPIGVFTNQAIPHLT